MKNEHETGDLVYSYMSGFGIVVETACIGVYNVQWFRDLVLGYRDYQISAFKQSLEIKLNEA